ncbi:MAG: hypothetical protein R3E79_29155 [Caldilineaceae bacterium]
MNKEEKLQPILESAVTMPWDATIKRMAPIVFGRSQRLTWAMLKLLLRLMPMTITKVMMQEFTTLKVAVYNLFHAKNCLWKPTMLMRRTKLRPFGAPVMRTR